MAIPIILRWLVCSLGVWERYPPPFYSRQIVVKSLVLCVLICTLHYCYTYYTSAFYSPFYHSSVVKVESGCKFHYYSQFIHSNTIIYKNIMSVAVNIYAQLITCLWFIEK
jgi:hypothetical protein